MLLSIFMIGTGGFIGSVFRYLLTYYVNLSSETVFPLGTLAVNIVGSFLIGIIIAVAVRENLSQQTTLFLATGFCGGFTTFSSFSYEFFSLLQNEHTGYAFLYAASSFGLGLLSVWLGFILMKT